MKVARTRTSTHQLSSGRNLSCRSSASHCSIEREESGCAYKIISATANRADVNGRLCHVDIFQHRYIYKVFYNYTKAFHKVCILCSNQ